MSNRVDFLGKSPAADALFRDMEKRLGGGLDGYDVLALTYDGPHRTGALSVKWADGYAAVDVYAPGFRPSRKIIKTFFAFVFARRAICLCVVRSGNRVSADFVRRIGFEEVGTFDEGTLFKLDVKRFEAKFFRRAYEN